MENFKKYLPWTIRIIISFLFLISAVAKLYPSPYFAISTFEVKQLYPLGFSEDFSVFFSRILIGIELALGILLLQNNFLRRIVVPSTILMLVVFTVHLGIDTIQTGGNSGNCGCFGSLLPMTPIEAIIKNVVAIILLVIYLYLVPKVTNNKSNFWILSTITLASILALFMIAPIQPKVADVVTEELETPFDNNETIETQTPDAVIITPTETVAVEETPKPVVVDEPTQVKSGYTQYFSNIDTGKKILALFVPGCEHCKDVAKELAEMKAKNKNFPQVQVIFMNEEPEKIPDFFSFAGTTYPYKIIEVIPFWKLLGDRKDTPGIIYFWNGNKIKEWDGINDKKFVGSELQTVLKKNYSDIKK